MSHESTAAALTIAHELDAHPSGRGIGRLAADLEGANADPVEIAVRGRMLNLHAKHNAKRVKIECELRDDGTVEWWLLLDFGGDSVGRFGKTLDAATNNVLPTISPCKRKIATMALADKMIAEQEAAEKSLAAHVGPQHPEEPVTHTSEATAQDFAGIAVPADAHGNGKVQQ